MVATDPEAKAAALEAAKQRIAKREEANQHEAMRALLSSAIGRDFLWWLLRIGKYGVQPFHPDPVQMGFNCGELNVGQQVLDLILTINPEGFVLMQKERLNAERERATAADSGTADDADDRVDS